jgi:hypothetical protein
MRYRLASAYLLVGVIACAWCTGCSSGAPKEGAVVLVTGKLTNGGQPLEVKPDGAVELIFTPKVEKGEEIPLNRIYRTNVDAQGGFKLTGSLGKGILPGKYQIAVYQWERVQLKRGEKPGKDVVKGRRDALQQKFAEKTSPIVRDITLQTTTLELDVSKPEG